jgi:hypothetical protein
MADANLEEVLLVDAGDAAVKRNGAVPHLGLDCRDPQAQTSQGVINLTGEVTILRGRQVYRRAGEHGKLLFGYVLVVKRWKHAGIDSSCYNTWSLSLHLIE